MPFGLSALATALAVSLLIAIRQAVNLTTVALALVLLVTLTAIALGSGPALLTSLLALLSFNYFFIPPIHTWTIGEPQNWVAFGIFVVTALTVGQLSSRHKQRAQEAESRRLEIEKLYQELRRAFEEASEAETLRRSEQLKTALLDAVTHDLRTPLTSIKASVTTLLGAGNGELGGVLDTEARRDLLLVINEESDRLDRFVEEMMAVARIEGGQLRLLRAPASVHDVVSTAIERAATPLQSHPVEITIADPLPPLLVDAPTISAVVFELVENAAKYSPAGHPIHVTAKHGEGAWIEIAVEDEGPGVPPSLRTRVFEKFFRAPGVPRGQQGFGMGLAIARGIVEAHGGRIWLETGRNGQGAVVRFTVPCQA